MCGIGGILHFDRADSVAEKSISDMMNQIRHRGPDDHGYFVDGRVGFGHRRLSIIDLSPLGKQPMFNDDQSVWLTFNGEIYNYRDLRSQLSTQGHSFKTQTDSEVIIRAYEEWGIECVKKLNGMFAFGIWDAKKQSLFLVRDRLGVKPLFYHQDHRGLRFASEIKAILADPQIERELDIAAVNHYLSLNYMPAPFTGFENISQLLPGQYLEYSNGKIEIHPYWDLHSKSDKSRNDRDYIDEFDRRLRKSIEMQLMSDVPFGAFLSGGLDSSSVVAYMTEILDKPVKTFSIGFAEESYDETPYAALVAKQLGTEHHQEIVRPNVVDLLSKIVWHSEEPTADASMVPVYVLSELTRKHVTMALSGDGADEILAGYPTYQAYYMAKIYRGLPGPLHSLIRNWVKKLPVSHSKLSFDYKAKAFVAGAELSPEEAHHSWRQIFSEEEKLNLLNSEFVGSVPTSGLYGNYFSKSDASNFLDKMLYADTRFYLPNDMLTKVDRMSMAHSLEVRVPFLDHELVEFLATVPPHLKLNRYFRKKYLLKKVMKNKLPKEILYRKKAGFNVPISHWISKDLRPMIAELLSERRIEERGLFRAESVTKLLKDHWSGQNDNGYKIWSLLILSIWMDLFKVKVSSKNILKSKAS